MSKAMLLVGDSLSDQNLYYKTHFLAGDNFLYAEADGRSVLLTNTMELGRAKKESSVSEVRTAEDLGFRDLLKELQDPTKAYAETMFRLIQDLGADTVVVQGRFPVVYADALREKGLQLEVEPRLLQMERRQKSEEEIRAMEQAQEATERATREGIDMIARSTVKDDVLQLDGAPLTSERLREAIELALMREDMDNPQGMIVAGGPGAADPHWAGSGRLRPGEAIILDIFPRSRQSRYFADMTRTVSKGEPTELLRKMYGSVLRAQEAAFQTIKAGVNGKDVHEAVEAVFEEDGFGKESEGPKYTHGTGHGLGLDVHEFPGMGRMDIELLENDVVTVEPGLYDPEVGGVRIEDVVVVTPEGYRNLTRFPKELVV